VEFEVHKVAVGQVSLRALGFSLSILSFHQCSILIFIHPASESNAGRNTNKTGNVRIMQQGGAFPQFLYFFYSPNSLIPFHSTTALLWQLNEHGNDTTYLTLRVKSLRFLPDCSQISIFSTELRKSPQYQIWCTSVKLEPTLYIRTAGALREDANAAQKGATWRYG